MLNIPECNNPACSFVLLFVVALLLKKMLTLLFLAKVPLTTRLGTMAMKNSTKHTPQLHARLIGEIPFTESIQSLVIFAGFIIYWILISDM